MKKSNIFDRTLLNLRNVWHGITQNARVERFPTLRPDLPEKDYAALKVQMQQCLDAKGGEVSARARAAALGEAYLMLDGVGKKRFIEVLAKEFAVDYTALQAISAKVLAEGVAAKQLELEAQLRQCLIPPRVKLLTQFNSLPSGVKFLVDLRAELRAHAKHDAWTRGLDDDLKTLLASWFDVGFLDLKRITWDAPASLLEKLMDYEAVHQFRSWDDMKNRLETDRRFYAFFHPRMPDEPLVFIQVALVPGIASNIQELLDEEAPVVEAQDANTAIFYSITNAQEGLQGVSLGAFLIKRVVDDLLEDRPGLKTFSTLSPVPGFVTYLNKLFKEERTVLLPGERESLHSVANLTSLESALSVPDWNDNQALAQAVQKPLTRLCAYYLVHEKQRGRALNPVANFHLNNGARLERINWLADCSKNGIRQSAGIMVNYLYKLSDIEQNHEAYRKSAKVTTSASVNSLLKMIQH